MNSNRISRRTILKSEIPLSQHDWRHHFQPYWGKLVSAKLQFDPNNVLTPGPGIFSSTAG